MTSDELIALGDNVWWWYQPEADWHTPTWAKGIVLALRGNKALIVYCHKERGPAKRWLPLSIVRLRTDEAKPTEPGSSDKLMHEWADEGIEDVPDTETGESQAAKLEALIVEIRRQDEVIHMLARHLNEGEALTRNLGLEDLDADPDD